MINKNLVGWLKNLQTLVGAGSLPEVNGWLKGASYPTANKEDLKPLTLNVEQPCNAESLLEIKSRTK